MKAEIDAKGVLIVSAETPIELYALRKWGEDGWELAAVDDNFLYLKKFIHEENK